MLDRHWKQWFRHFTKVNDWQVTSMDLAVVEEAYSLPDYVQRDPADRIIVATARLLQGAVVTADRNMLAYPHVDTVW
jgi:PIN domain nuclease of toxin-antitoxin system